MSSNVKNYLVQVANKEGYMGIRSGSSLLDNPFSPSCTEQYWAWHALD
jgi:hypothetical protein